MEFGLLGPVEARHDGRRVELTSPRARALLTVLLLRNGSPVSPDVLVDVLWCERPPPSASVTLRSHVARLRSTLAEARLQDGPRVPLVWRAGGYALDVAPESVDVHRFSELLARAEQATARGAAETAATALRGALGLWRGAALDEFADREFARADALCLEELRRSATEDLAEAELAAGRPGRALADLEGHVTAHPLRERACGLRMRALYRLGRQADALAAYRTAAAALSAELGIRPSPALQDLHDLILRQGPSLDWVPVAAEAILRETARTGALGAGSPRTPFVGRAAERARLRAALAGAAAGAGRLVLLGGEPGIGKTRLAEEVAQDADGLGMSAYAGHSYEAAGAPPYVAVIEIIEAALAAAPSAEGFGRDVLRDAAPEVARLVPRLRRLLPDLPPPLDLPAEQERRYLFTCLTEVIERVAAVRPALIVLDDFQWADAATLAFVEHLAAELHRLPVLVLATFRDADVGRPLAATFAELHRRRLAERVRLDRLSEAEASAMLAALAGAPPTAPVAAAFYTRTEGHPFFLEEVFRDLAGQRRLRAEMGNLTADPGAVSGDVPEGVRLVIQRRVERLSPDVQQLLTAAAVAGRVFSVRLLEALSGMGRAAVLDAMDEARSAVLVLDRGGDLLFTHELIRQALVSELSTGRRRDAHVRAADALRRVWADDLDGHAAEIVHHLTEAGEEADPGLLFAMLVRAGHRALATSAFDEAAGHLERAATLAGDAAPAERAELYLVLGSARQRRRDWDGALAAWARSLDEFEALGDTDAVGRAARAAAEALVSAGRMPESVAMCQRGLAVLGDRVSGDRARLLAVAGMVLQFVDPAAGDPLFDEALRIDTALDDDRLRGFVHEAICSGSFGSMRSARGHAAAMVALPLLRAAGDLWQTAQAETFAQCNLVHMGRFAESAELSRDTPRLAERVGHHLAHYGHGRVWRARVYFVSGDLADLEAAGRWDLEVATRMGWTPWTGHAYSRLGLVQFYVGDWDAAAELLARGAALAESGSYGGFSWAARLHFLAAAGHHDEALSYLDGLRGELPQAGRPNTLGAWALLAGAVDALALLGDRVAVADWYPLVLQALATGSVIAGFLEGRVLERLAGLAAAAGGQFDLAEGHFRTALAQTERMPHQVERLQTRRSYAGMLAGRRSHGDADLARVLLSEAAEGYRRLRMPRHAEESSAAHAAI